MKGHEHNSWSVPAAEGSSPLAPEVALVAESMSRLVELSGLIGWGGVAAFIRDLSAYAEMGRIGVGEFQSMELRLVVSTLAGDLTELRAAHSEMAGKCSKQAHHKIMMSALTRIGARNPEVARVLHELREYKFAVEDAT